ncbi:MAG: TauD/TfdA dioxygenase family protein [Acidimicrobiia bacterium]
MEAHLDVKRISGALGAEVDGVQLRDLDDDTWAQLRKLWLQHLVLFFPEQHLTPAEHVAFARRFGDIEIHPFGTKLDAEHPEIIVADSDLGARTDLFHTDVTFSPTPPMASILSMKILPPYGGDTIWTNQHLAYEALAPAMRSFIDGLTATHNASFFGHPEIETRHPVVRVHPETGRRSLFVNRGFTRHINELGKTESDALLDLVFQVSEEPPFQCRYRWTEGTIAIWDNRCTQHYVVNDYSGRRRIERVTVLGDEPSGPARQWEDVETRRTRVASTPTEIDERANSIALVTSS